MLTPWGRSDQLRDRRLRPGPGKQRADVERNHRERLYGAMVAVVDESGYEGMSVGAVASRAGVSRSALYEYFSGAPECFLATFETLLEDGLATVSRAYAADDGPWDARLRRAFDTLLETIVGQPAAARLCFLEAYAAGEAGAALRARGSTTLEALMREALDQSPSRAGMPPEVIAAMVGGIRTVVQTRLRRRQEAELPTLAPELMHWLTGYERPSPPLRRELAGTSGASPRFVAATHRDRLFVALATAVYAKGYEKTNVADIVTVAGVSLSTFYEYFDGKEAAFLAACDFGIEQAFAAVRHAFERAAPDGWPAQVRAAMRELLAFLASEPEWSYVAMVEIFAAGGRARARRDRTIELFTTMVDPARDLEPRVGSVTIEALGGAIYSLMYGQISRRGAGRLPELLPVSIFVLLAPFVGSQAAAELASAP